MAAIKANRAGIRNDLIDRSLDQQAARQQIRLAQAEFDHNVEMDKEGLALEQSAAAGGGSGGSGGSGNGTFGGVKMSGEAAKLARDGIASWRAQPDSKRTLNSFIARVTQSTGFPRLTAAKIALNMLSTSELKRYSGSSNGLYKALTGAGVKPKAAQSWVNKVYGEYRTDMVGSLAGQAASASKPYSGGSKILYEPITNKPIIPSNKVGVWKVVKQFGQWVVVYKSTGKPVPSRFL
jgi:hypothetical protein